MGVSIHYSGKLLNPSDLSEFMHEVIDLCQSLRWDHQYIPPDEDSPIEGVIIYIEGCDPVVLTFLPGGRLCHPLFYSYLKKVEQAEKIETADQWVITYTQDAGPQVHMELIRILHFLHEKYFEDFQVDDSSHYWETGNEEMCRRAFANANDELRFPTIDPGVFKDTFKRKTVMVKRKLRRKY